RLHRRTLNLGILAHVDAGKTTLTERLLYAAGVIDEVGSVDHGSTQTDFLALERQRGITIRSAVVSFVIGDVTVNLIDTPGHPDFIAEVERVLGVLDGAVLVVSAVEGVQPQTRILMRALRRLHIPTLVFVNKIDRRGARAAGVLEQLASTLTPNVIPMGSASGLGTRRAAFMPYGEGDPGFVDALVDVLSAGSDAFLGLYVEGGSAVTFGRMREELLAQTARAMVHPVYFGSAITGAGVESLVAGLRDLLPADRTQPDGALSGTVFKVERGPAGERLAYLRMFSGSVRVRDRLRIGDGDEQKVTAISVFHHGEAVPASCVRAGQIGRLAGLHTVQIGDHIGLRPSLASGDGEFAPPTLATVVEPVHSADRGALQVALLQLAEQDPLINLRRDDLRQETSLSLYGEVQKEVIAATLASDFGVEVTFRESTVICIERPVGIGEAFEVIATPPNPFLATIGLRIEPGPVGSGLEFHLGIELGALPLAFIKAVEETVAVTLEQGLHGWKVLDSRVTLTRSGYWPRQSHAHGTFDKSMSSTAGDFRNLTPLVLMTALERAGTRVHEPVHRFRLEAPADALGTLLPTLGQLRAVPEAPSPYGSGYVVEGDIPAARVTELRQVLPTLTRGEGVLETAFDHYAPVTGPVPDRPRTDRNPLDRKEYLLRTTRRVG
ncbi:MAG: GTP-binding protein, partial [Nocardioidaceae bacterium]